MSPRPPWPVWREPSRRMLEAMIGGLEGLPMTGAEFSVRLTPESIECGRWLAGFSTSGLSPSRLQSLSGRLGLDAASARWFAGQGPLARQIGLAVEQTAAQSVAKLYLEWPLPAPDLRERPPERRQVALQISSCKWLIEGPQELPGALRQTEYWRLSGVDARAIVALLQEPQEALEDRLRQAYGALAQCLLAALNQAPHWREPRLLLVRDAGSARRGVGLRFYGSDLKVGAVLEPLRALCRGWGLNLEARPDILAFWADQELGWLHAGLDGRGEVFIIIYGAIPHDQARSVLSKYESAALQLAM